MTDTLNQLCDRAEALLGQCLHGQGGCRDHAASLLDETRHVRETYALMLRCLLAGQQDEATGRIYLGLCARAQTVIDRAAHLLGAGGSLPVPFDFGKHDVDRHFDLIVGGDTWTPGQWEQARAWMHDEGTGTLGKCLLASALSLALLRLFDPAKMHLLMDAWEDGEPEVRRRALVGLTLAFWHCGDRLSLHPSLAQRTSLLMGGSAFRKGLFLALRLLEQSRLTPRVSRKLGQDILPAIMRGGHLKKLVPGADEVERSLTEQGENLEWFIPTDADAAAQTKMREMAQMQLSGADIYWSTFQQVRQRMKPFFAQTANYFRPFSKDEPLVRDTLALCNRQEADLLLALVNSAPFCDCDKFAFITMLDMIGAGGRNTLVRTLQGQLDGDDIHDALSSMGETFRSEETRTRRYVWNLYRYCMAQPPKVQANPFDAQLPHFSPLAQAVFAPLLDDTGQVDALAQSLLRDKLYAPALALFQSMAEHGSPHTATRWQEMGFCLQKMGDGQAACQAYKQALSMDPTSQWTLKHLAALSLRQGSYIEAEAFCDMLLDDNPDCTQWLAAKARALSGRRLHAQATPLLYKAAYLAPTDESVWRQLALTLALDGQPDKARETLQTMPHGNMNEMDWAFLQATVQLANHDFAQAHHTLAPLRTHPDFNERLNETLQTLGTERISQALACMFRDSLQGADKET